ncbi:MAG: membrane protein insertion efficiency factor YidD [Patescibacteria group bacterium]|nr:membrane protein insertion efficiency factor YidD [Patescibacteria group bacterium]
MLKQTILKLIKLYQKTLSVDHGLFSFLSSSFSIGCRFQPTCSEYAYQAVEKYGALKGVFLSVKRILRCHPFSKGGFDPVK